MFQQSELQIAQKGSKFSKMVDDYYYDYEKLFLREIRLQINFSSTEICTYV